nr:immunoglobulin heavy chain junction region [Mus musculus]
CARISTTVVATDFDYW